MIRQSTIDRHVGKKYGRLTVVSYSHQIGKTGYFYKTVCECGTPGVTRLSCMQQGTTRSCGCYWLERSSEANRGNTVRRMDFGKGARNNLLRRYRLGAETRGYSFDLSEGEFDSLTKGDCFYCGSEPQSVNKPKCCYGEYVYNGIDRVDNSLGYVADNCVSCCAACNSKKADITAEMIRKANDFLARRETERVRQVAA